MVGSFEFEHPDNRIVYWRLFGGIWEREYWRKELIIKVDLLQGNFQRRVSVLRQTVTFEKHHVRPSLITCVCQRALVTHYAATSLIHNDHLNLPLRLVRLQTSLQSLLNSGPMARRNHFQCLFSGDIAIILHLMSVLHTLTSFGVSRCTIAQIRMLIEAQHEMREPIELDTKAVRTNIAVKLE
ncbi:hypothetical protein BDZ94DRAFT_577762 [Collybia nuda]|uniref:Uncharacterized protein n=1 Tax=Collybia nuda TaxID=64659 RepID=A0A9P6CFF9_9AGAR|nr:hypothetical protein BDZ94DRAFT_577762 [Collybia nuda]